MTLKNDKTDQTQRAHRLPNKPLEEARLQSPTFSAIVEKYLGEPAPISLTDDVNWESLSIEARLFLRRALSLMKTSEYSVNNFSPHLIRWLVTTVPNMLPAAWGGRIPPITIPGRHKKFDDYISTVFGHAMDEPHIYIDVGCGFPPLTTTETARRFGYWQVYGIDKSFATYVLYDENDHYACFDERGKFQYFQAMNNISGRALYAEPESAHRHFNALFRTLHPLLKHDRDGGSEVVEKDKCRLILNHIRDFEMSNLTLIEMDVADVELPPAKVLRCMNLFIYFDIDKRREMLVNISRLLDDAGLLLVGSNGLGIQSRYAVYEKSQSGLWPREFSFSLDNLGHIVFMPWLTVQDNDPEAVLLAELTGAIRKHRSFWEKFSARLDDLFRDHRICRRGSDGFLHFQTNEMPIAEYMEKNALIWNQMEVEGYVEAAIDALNHNGYEAWKNPVGDIAVLAPLNRGL